MLDLGISKMALIGAVALIVIGPEKLPRVARTVGTLLGKAQRYVSDVKAEVNRAMDLDELKKMKESVEEAGREVEKGIYSTKADFEKDWSDVTAGLEGAGLAQERRATRLRPDGLAWQWLAAGVLELRFSLPAGAYATSVLAELGPTHESGTPRRPSVGN